MLAQSGWRQIRIWSILCGVLLGFCCTTTFAQPLHKKWQIHVISYTELSFLDQTLQNVKQGLFRAGYEEGRHYDMTVRSAQGDIATVMQMLDAAREAKADLVIPLQDITLQAAIHRLKNIPIIFDVVADPFLIGAGTTDKDHLPNVTGIYSIFATDRMIQLIRSCTPGVTSIGLLFRRYSWERGRTTKANRLTLRGLPEG